MPLSSFLKRKIKGRDYSELQKNLRKIRVPRSPHEYVAQAITYSVVLAVILAPTFYFVFSFLLDISLLLSLGLSVGIGGGLGLAVYFLFLFYPKLKAASRRDEIEDMLPHATAYMLALSKGGFEPIEIFDSLSEQEEYGEIAKEAGAVARNSRVLGYSPTEAIEDVVETTPSQEFADFLTSFSSVIETGSSIIDFLHRRSDRYYEEAEERQEENLEFLGMLSEAYVASLGLGPIFGIILLILFGMMGQFMTNILYLIVYLLIPLVTGAFIVILDMQSRARFGEGKTGEKSESSGKSFLSSINGKINHSKDRLKSIRSLTLAPPNVLWVSLPAGAIISMVLFSFLGVGIETAITFFTLISLTPLAIFFELERRRKERMIKVAPDFLTSFSESLSSGLSLSKALFSLSPERYGELKQEIERVRGDIEWGNSVSEAFRKSSERMASGIISRVMSLVRRSSEVASDISGILEVLAEDVNTEKSLQEGRKRVTVTYVVIVFLTFGIFLLTAYILSSSFVPLMTRFSEAEGGAAGQTQAIQISGVEPSTIKQAFFRASLMQGFFSGLLAGMMQTGRLSSGLKYSVIMLGVAWAFFTFLGV